jgi:hypothetical protein|tara:strand:- start:3812 stop:4225 length:414 start_codon:yes stop_codon:yes gene_type:complete
MDLCKVMPLIVGIVNGIEKGFSESEIQLVNGFGFGLLAQNAGVGSMSVRYGGAKITPEEFRRRMLLCNFANEIYKMSAFYETMTLEFCQRLMDADWSCNVSTYDKRKFNSEYKNWLVRLNQLEFDAFERAMQRGEEE